MSKYPEVTIKGLKTGNMPGIEGGLPFTASVYVDGKRFCTAEDHGDGGGVNFDRIDRIDYASKWHNTFLGVLQRINKELKEFHPKEPIDFGDRKPLNMSLGLKVGLLVEAEETWKTIQKNLKKGIVYYDPEKEKFFIYPQGTTPEEVTEFRKRTPSVKLVLNDMPKEKAVQAWNNPKKYLESA